MRTVRIRTLAVLSIGALLAALMGCREEETLPPTPQGAPEPAVQDTINKPEPQVGQSESEAKKAYREGAQAMAEMKPTQGNDVRGEVIFTRAREGVRVTADLQGLSPGKHGIHVHENGDCSAPDASSAGGHFNPEGTPHGAPDNPPGQRHVGDLGNLEAKEDGTAHFETIDKVITLSGEHSVIGRAVVVHAGTDDFQSQPAGDSGPRVACGVIEEVKKQGE